MNVIVTRQSRVTVRVLHGCAEVITGRMGIKYHSQRHILMMKDIWIDQNDIDGMVGRNEFVLPRNWIAIPVDEVRRLVDPGGGGLR